MFVGRLISNLKEFVLHSFRLQLFKVNPRDVCFFYPNFFLGQNWETTYCDEFFPQILKMSNIKEQLEKGKKNYRQMLIFTLVASTSSLIMLRAAVCIITVIRRIVLAVN